MKRVVVEDGIQTTVAHQAHEGKIYVERKDITEARLYEQNAQLRRLGIHRKEVRLGLNMSQSDFTELVKRHPGLVRGTMDERRRAHELVAKERPELVMKEFKNKFSR